MKIAIVADKKNTFGDKLFREKLQSHIDAEVFYLCNDAGLSGKLRELAPDMLLTVDLQGFEHRTLTGNLSYNLLDCKQVHLLLHDNLQNEHFLSGQLSISMFFYCLGQQYFQHLGAAYPDIPVLRQVPAWNWEQGVAAAQINAEVLTGILREVMEECRLL